ncbi:MAG: fibro-slime domain-containing protein [Planctomycetota bacterium]
MTLFGVARDFLASNQPGGHPDFENITGAATIGLVENTLDAQSKPVFKNHWGYAIDEPYLDFLGRPINPAFYDPSLGDVEGELNGDDREFLTSSADFAAWYRDVPGVNLSTAVPLQFVVQPDGTYVFDSDEDPYYQALGGFFPVNNRLWGNYPGPWKNGPPPITHNYHFTFELTGRFVYDAGAGYVFTFRGDDDVWVFIDGQLVIDLGGVHNAQEQSVILDRLDWLVDGEEYSLNFFYAERHTNSANCRIQTNFLLQNAGDITVWAQFD